jgi:hypothetical protein
MQRPLFEKDFSVYFLLLFILSLICSGCLSLDKMTMVYDIQPDMSGSVEVYASRVRSEETLAADQKAEMAELYAELESPKGLQNFEQEMATSMPGYHSWSLAVLNKTDMSCDLHIRGQFDNFFDSPIVDASALQYESEGGKVAVRLKTQELKDGDLPILFTIRYRGPVLEHNAMQVEPQTMALIWDLSKFNDDLFLVLGATQTKPASLPATAEGIRDYFETGYPDDLYACQEDQDCIKVKTSCCQGTAAIAQRFQSEWQVYLEQQCQHTDCPQVPVPEGFVPVCQQQRCQIEHRDYSQSTFSECLMITDTLEKSRCYLAVANQQKDISGCFYVEQKDLQFRCLARLLPLVKVEESLCFETVIAEDQGLSAICWHRLAQNTAAPHYCGRIPSPTSLGQIQLQGRCYRETLPLVVSPDQCAHFEPLSMQDPNIGYLFGSCIQQAALKQGAVEVCDQIPEGRDYYPYWFNCIIGVAEQTQNSGLCGNVNKRLAPAGYSAAFSESGCRKKVENGHF